MKKSLILAVFAIFVGAAGNAHAVWTKTGTELIELNKKLHGKVLDYTANHACDNRIWSRSLGQRRDMYVYLPPNFDPRERYPVMILLHGLGQDEQVMLDFAPLLDKSIYVGDLPPMIVAAPDGTVNGEPSTKRPPTFFLNSNLGDFEDYLLIDVWDYLVTHFPIRSEREAHVLAGVSMGGFAAFNIGIRYRCCFGVAIGVHPPLNMRWMDECGNYSAKFNPYHWGWRTNFDRPTEVIGRFGLQAVRVGQLTNALFDSPDEALAEISRYNPIELVERTCLRNGQLQMYVGYACHDEFNIDAQVESFLYLCKFRRINVAVGYDPEGHHNLRTAYRLWPGIVTWLGPRLTTVKMPNYASAISSAAQPNVTRRVAPLAEQPAGPQGYRPQPVNTIWAPPHVQPLTGSVSRPPVQQGTDGDKTGPLPPGPGSGISLHGPPGSESDSQPSPPPPSVKPLTNELPTTPPPTRPTPPPVSRQDLGPPAQMVVPYGPYEQPAAPPGPPATLPDPK